MNSISIKIGQRIRQQLTAIPHEEDRTSLDVDAGVLCHAARKQIAMDVEAKDQTSVPGGKAGGAAYGAHQSRRFSSHSRYWRHSCPHTGGYILCNWLIEQRIALCLRLSWLPVAQKLFVLLDTC